MARGSSTQLSPSTLGRGKGKGLSCRVALSLCHLMASGPSKGLSLAESTLHHPMGPLVPSVLPITQLCLSTTWGSASQQDQNESRVTQRPGTLQPLCPSCLGSLHIRDTRVLRQRTLSSGAQIGNKTVPGDVPPPLAANLCTPHTLVSS